MNKQKGKKTEASKIRLRADIESTGKSLEEDPTATYLLNLGTPGTYCRYLGTRRVVLVLASFSSRTCFPARDSWPLSLQLVDLPASNETRPRPRPLLDFFDLASIFLDASVTSKQFAISCKL